MASDSSDATRRKHHRSPSAEDEEERSKRHKHRHRHRHHHRHRRSKDKEQATPLATEDLVGEQIDEIVVDARKLGSNRVEDKDASADVLVSGGSGYAGVDYEMEEGEIVEDDGLINFVNEDSEKSNKKNLHSDVESGEIETSRCDRSNMGVIDEDEERLDKKIGRLVTDGADGKQTHEMDQEESSNSENLANGNPPQKCHEVDDKLLYGDGKRIDKISNEVEPRSKKSSSYEEMPKSFSPSHSHEKYLKESSHSNLSKLPEPSRGRSRSRSIARSVEDRYYIDRRHPNDSDDVKVKAHLNEYRRSSTDDVMDKARERTPSRYLEGLGRHYSREHSDAYRESSRERDIIRGKETEREERERERERDRLSARGERERDLLKDRARHRDREQEKDKDRERDRERERQRRRDGERERRRDVEKDKERVDRNKYRDRSREGARDGRMTRSNDKDRYNESDQLGTHQKYGKVLNGYRDRDNDSWHRNSGDSHKGRRSRDDLGRTSKDKRDEQGSDSLDREDDGQEDYQDKITMQLADQEEDDLEKIKEESRRRTQAILEKYRNKPNGGTQPHNKVEGHNGGSLAQMPPVEVAQKKLDNQLEGTDIYVPEPSFSIGKSPSQNGLSAFQMPSGTAGLGEGTPKSERSADMFSDDIVGESPAGVRKASERSADMFSDDIFGESPAGVRKAGKGDAVAVEKSGLNDNWDDAEGYYGYRFGEILDGRYEIIASHGKGVFSTVVRARDLKGKNGDPEEVAIKIIRNNETMYKAGMEELVILKKLVGTDPENKRHCVRFLSTFKYRNHLCLVFESLNMNLREVLKKFGRNIGLKLTAVRAYAKQLFIALKHLKNCGVLHCDIKPDNMLVNEAKNVLKLCDFGNAMFAGKNEITPYLVSRFYRAPEIILGLTYDHPMDIWSVGCCLFEIYTGKVLFPGATNNDMLRLQMELKGPFPKKMLRKGAFTDQHFDSDLNFLATEEDLVSKKTIRRLIVNIKPKDFGTLIWASSGEDQKMVADFKDLLEKIFILDPDKRINVSQALSHPFITGK